MILTEAAIRERYEDAKTHLLTEVFHLGDCPYGYGGGTYCSCPAERNVEVFLRELAGDPRESRGGQVLGDYVMGKLVERNIARAR